MPCDANVSRVTELLGFALLRFALRCVALLGFALLCSALLCQALEDSLGNPGDPWGTRPGRLIEESLDKVLEVFDDEEEEESDDEEDVCCVLCNGYVCKFCEEVEHKDERDEAICDTCYHEHY